MFKMGCSMARKILGPGSGSSSNEQMAASSAGAKGEPSEKNGKQTNKSADELGDFSKLEDDPRLPLNVRQIFKITKSWKAIARTMSKTGTAMFLNLFEQNQDLFYLFDRFQHLKGKELHDSMELREHAATVMATLDQSINSLSDYDNFVSYLHSIGELHRKVPGFKREYFWKIEQPFMKAVKQTLDERCNETIEQIYMIAIKLIIETIAQGYGQDDSSAVAAADFEAKGGAGGGAAKEPSDRGVKEEKVGGREVSGKSGAGQKGGAQQERNNCNENKRADWPTNGNPASEPLPARGCPISRESPSEHKQISEKKSIRAKGHKVGLEAGSIEGEASLVEATCELMRSTANWLSQSGQAHEPTQVQWQRLINDLSATASSLAANEKATKCADPDEGQLALFMRSSETDRLKADGRKRADEKRQETAGCPRTPASQYNSTAASPLKHQTIISSCPENCGALSEPRFHFAQSGGVCKVQGLQGAAGAEDKAPAMGRSSVSRADYVANIGPNEEKLSAMTGGCNNNNELVRSQVTKASDCARVTLQLEVPMGGPERPDLIKSARRRLGGLVTWRTQLNGASKLARLLAGWPKSARSPGSQEPTLNGNQSDTGRGLDCARQSLNNNKLQITPALPTVPSARDIRLEAHSGVDKCKQGEQLEASPAVDDRPPGRQELRGARARVAPMLHKSESAVLKLLADAPRDTQLAELIKVLLLINRLLLTLVSRPQRQSTDRSNTEASTQRPLLVAS